MSARARVGLSYSHTSILLCMHTCFQATAFVCYCLLCETCGPYRVCLNMGLAERSSQVLWFC